MSATGKKRALRVLKMTYAALYLALAMVLPFITGQIPQIGQMLSPMHLPVLLCGFVCGGLWGMAVGFIAPLFRSVLFGMPAMFPGAVAMAFELAVYGGLTGFLRGKLPKKIWMIYVILIVSMLSGRAVWGLVRLALSGLSGGGFTMAAFLTGAFTGAVPGIILQLVLVPVLVMIFEAAGLSLNRE